MIHSGEWPLQQRIPSEPELMARLGVSRGTLREAVKALAHSGMLEVRRGDGTYVRATSEMSGAARRLYQDHTAEHILEVRLGLDTQAARLAATQCHGRRRHGPPRRSLTDRDQAWRSRRREAWARRTGASTHGWRRPPAIPCCMSCTSALARFCTRTS